MVFLIALLVILVGVVVAVVSGRVGGSRTASSDGELAGEASVNVDTMDEATSSSSFSLPAGHLGSNGASKIQLDQSLRGYNMAQVDAVLDRLFTELAELEVENRRLSKMSSGRDGLEHHTATTRHGSSDASAH